MEIFLSLRSTLSFSCCPLDMPSSHMPSIADIGRGVWPELDTAHVHELTTHQHLTTFLGFGVNMGHNDVWWEGFSPPLVHYNLLSFILPLTVGFLVGLVGVVPLIDGVW
jgi:hypothetical protein